MRPHGAQVGPGRTVAVVGDGAVGLCGVIAAKRLGAEQIILIGRHPDRIALGRDFGATDIVTERGEEAVERVLRCPAARAFTRCWSASAPSRPWSMRLASRARGARSARRRSALRRDSSAEPTFFKNVTIGGGPAPVRAYIDELLPDVLEGRIQPGRVFDRDIGLEEVPDGYRAMDAREALKVMVKP